VRSGAGAVAAATELSLLRSLHAHGCQNFKRLALPQQQHSTGSTPNTETTGQAAATRRYARRTLPSQAPVRGSRRALPRTFTKFYATAGNAAASRHTKVPNVQATRAPSARLSWFSTSVAIASIAWHMTQVAWPKWYVWFAYEDPLYGGHELQHAYLTAMAFCCLVFERERETREGQASVRAAERRCLRC
jgi:hypothetical protein